jgi:L-threonylcarbamoyladenylate synthase
VKRLPVDAHNPDVSVIQEAAEALREGKVVAYPTDTLYAFAVDPRSDRTVEKLFALKRRDAAIPIALIAADLVQAREAGAFGPPEIRLADAFWPGPLTIVVRAGSGLSRLLSGDSHTLGIRVPSHDVARGLAAAFGTCITATSANLSGQPAATTSDEVAATFSADIDVLLEGGPVPGGPPSTIVQVVEGRPVLHRAGAVAWDRVLKSLE